MPCIAAVVPLHKSRVDMPQFWSQRSARASESRRRNWTVDLHHSACPRFTRVARHGVDILVILVRLPSDLQVMHGRHDREGSRCF